MSAPVHLHLLLAYAWCGAVSALLLPFLQPPLCSVPTCFLKVALFSVSSTALNPLVFQYIPFGRIVSWQVLLGWDSAHVPILPYPSSNHVLQTVKAELTEEFIVDSK